MSDNDTVEMLINQLRATDSEYVRRRARGKSHPHCATKARSVSLCYPRRLGILSLCLFAHALRVTYTEHLNMCDAEHVANHSHIAPERRAVSRCAIRSVLIFFVCVSSSTHFT